MSKMVAPPAGRSEPAAQPPAAYGKDQMTDLEGHIAFDKSEVLNAKGKLDTVLKQGLRDQDTMLLASDADEELLMNVAFKSAVKVHSLALMAPDDGRAPLKLRLIINKTGQSFDDARDGAAAQELELTPAQFGERIELRFVKFQNVANLTIFIASNQGDEETTALSGIKLWGAVIGGTNMAEFKRVTGEAGEGE